MTDNELYSMFITCGPLVSAKIMRDRNSGYSYGYGFVQYQVKLRLCSSVPGTKLGIKIPWVFIEIVPNGAFFRINYCFELKDKLGPCHLNRSH
jgi:hypothetical protein